MIHILPSSWSSQHIINFFEFRKCVRGDLRRDTITTSPVSRLHWVLEWEVKPQLYNLLYIPFPECLVHKDMCYKQIYNIWDLLQQLTSYHMLDKINTWGLTEHTHTNYKKWISIKPECEGSLFDINYNQMWFLSIW